MAQAKPGLVASFLMRVRRSDAPFYRVLRKTAKTVRSSTLPLPRFVHPVLRGIFYLHMAMWRAGSFLLTYFYREPLFRSRCISVGRRFRMHRLPFIVGHASITIGDDVNFFGQVDIFSGGIFEAPRLILKDRVDLGHEVVFIVNQEIVIEEDVNVASRVQFMDTDAHPRDIGERTADLPPRPEEVKPVRICRGAWIGGGSWIMKGVTVGEGAIIGVNSVVVTDIPAFSVAMGNPARVVVKAPPKAPRPELVT